MSDMPESDFNLPIASEIRTHLYKLRQSSNEVISHDLIAEYLSKYFISEQNVKDTLASKDAEHKQELLDLCDKVERMLVDGYSYAAIEYELNEIKQMIKKDEHFCKL